MSPVNTPHIKGWCPGALRPMLSGDGLVVRVRPRAGRLTPVQAAGLAALASRHGNGLIDLTSRANLQLRGVSQAAHPAVLEGLRALDLLDASPEAESRRNIVLTPFWQPEDGTLRIAEDLAEALAVADAPPLPGKFGFAVDRATQPTLRGSSADIRLECGPQGWTVWADGYASGALVAADDAADTAMALARWFMAQGSGTAGRKRMAALAPQHPLPQRFQAIPVAPVASSKAQPGVTAQGWLVGAEFGQLQASTLAALAGLGALRMTPWQMLLVEGARQAPGIAGLVTQAGDARLRVVACSGAPACLQALAATRPLARALAAQVPVDRLLHISGCSKGCAHPRAALTLVATATGFDLIHNGTASAPPDMLNLPTETIASHLSPIFHAPRI